MQPYYLLSYLFSNNIFLLYVQSLSYVQVMLGFNTFEKWEEFYFTDKFF
jgi:hypothetical protein